MYADLAPKLFDNGWRGLLPLGVYPSGRLAPPDKAKIPFFKGWSRRSHEPITREELDKCVKRYPRAGIGFAFGPAHNLVAVDLDVEDPDESERARGIIIQTLPRTDFYRIGKPPKILLLYRGLARSRKPHGLGVEIFASSGQTAFFAVHPKTGRPYEWPRLSPLDHTPDDLPEIEDTHIEAFLSRWSTSSPKVRGTSGSNSCPPDLFAHLRQERQIDGDNAAARQLMTISKGERHSTMLSVTGYLVSTGREIDEIVAFVDDFFPAYCRDAEWSDPGAVARKMAERAAEKFYHDPDWELTE